jgi:hypothetical protein
MSRYVFFAGAASFLPLSPGSDAIKIGLPLLFSAAG